MKQSIKRTALLVLATSTATVMAAPLRSSDNNGAIFIHGEGPRNMIVDIRPYIQHATTTAASETGSTNFDFTNDRETEDQVNDSPQPSYKVNGQVINKLRTTKRSAKSDEYDWERGYYFNQPSPRNFDPKAPECDQWTADCPYDARDRVP